MRQMLLPVAGLLLVALSGVFTPHTAANAAAPELVDVATRVVGYRSGGTADIEIIAILSGGGDRRSGSFELVAATCFLGGVRVAGCEDSTSVRLSAGFATTEVRLTVRAPMGSDPVELRLSVNGEPSTALEVDVPVRVLGVGRHVWDCYRGGPGHMDRCGGWLRGMADSRVKKWEPGRPIKTWVSGRADYLVEVERILAQISELMNHTFEMVDSREEADLVAQIAAPYDVVAAECNGGTQCGFAHSVSPTVTSGEAHVADRSNLDRVVTHELMHALIPQGHFASPYTLLGTIEGLSAIDEALLRFHADPAMEPGMTAQQVEELIVFSDELLDAPPLDLHMLVWRAREALLRAGSAVFITRGSCLTDLDACYFDGLWDFGWSDHWIGEFQLPGNHLQRLSVRNGIMEAYVAGKEFWTVSPRGEWYRIDWPAFSRATLWRPNYTSVLTILENILLLARTSDVIVEERPDGTLVLQTLEGRELRLYGTVEMDVSLVLDAGTLHVTEYDARIQYADNAEPAPGSGESVGSAPTVAIFEVQARAGSYGGSMTVPEPIRQSTPTPTRWQGVARVSTLSAGQFHTCALRGDGTPVCWGSDLQGASTPPDGERFVSISSGSGHTCGLRQDGSAVCWGHSAAGQDQHFTSREGLWTVPYLLSFELGYLAKPVTIMRFTSMSSSGSSTCAIRADGAPYCWGTTDDAPDGERLVLLSTAPGHTCALREDGTPVCWGRNDFGEASPPAGELFVALSSGAQSTCALREDGTPVCWGRDDSGEWSPPAGERFAHISSGTLHTCALRVDGTPVCWGLNPAGQASPPAGERFVSISSGYAHTCALREDGTPVCWGSDSTGQSSPPEGAWFAIEW